MYTFNLCNEGSNNFINPSCSYCFNNTFIVETLISYFTAISDAVIVFFFGIESLISFSMLGGTKASLSTTFICFVRPYFLFKFKVAFLTTSFSSFSDKSNHFVLFNFFRSINKLW